MSFSSRDISPSRYITKSPRQYPMPSASVNRGDGRMATLFTAANDQNIITSSNTKKLNGEAVGAVLQKYGYRSGLNTESLTQNIDQSTNVITRPSAYISLSEGATFSSPTPYQSSTLVDHPNRRLYRSVRDGNINVTSHIVSRGTTEISLNATNAEVSPADTQTNLQTARIASLEARLVSANVQKEEAEKQATTLTTQVQELTKRVEFLSSNKSDLIQNTNNGGSSNFVQVLEKQQQTHDEDIKRLTENHNAALAIAEEARDKLTLRVRDLAAELEKCRKDSLAKDDEVIRAKRQLNDIQLRFDKDHLAWETQIGVLKGQVASNGDEVIQLRQQLARERDLREQEGAESDRLRERLDALSRRVLEQESQVGEQSITTKAALQNQQKEFEAKIADLKHQLTIETQRRSRDSNERDGLQRQLENAISETSNLRNELSDEKRRVQELRNALADAQKFAMLCEAKDLEVRRLTESNDRAREHLSNERRLKENVEARLAFVVEERDKHAAAEEGLRKQVIDELQPTIQRLQKEVSDGSTVIATLRLDSQGSSQVKSQLDHIVRAKERLAEELTSERHRSNSLEEALASAKQEAIEASRASEAHRILQRNLSADLVSAKEKASRVEGLEDKVFELERTVETITRTKENAEKQMYLVETSLRARDEEIGVLLKQQASSSGFEATITSLNQQLLANRSLISQQERALETSRAENQRLAEEVKEISRIAGETQAARGNITAERNNFEHLWREERDKYFHVSQKLEEAYAQVANYHLEIDHRKQIADEIPILRQQIEALAAVKKDQQEAIRRLTAEVTETSTAVVRAELDRDEAVRKAAKFEIGLEGAERQLSILRSELTNTTGEHGALQVRHEDLEKRYKTLVNEIDGHAIKLAAAESDNAELAIARSELLATVAQLKTEILAKSDECERNEKSITSLKSRISQLEELNTAAARRISGLESDNKILADTRNTISTLEGTIEGQQKVIADKDRERQALEAEIARLREIDTDYHGSESRNVSLQNQVDELRRALQKKDTTLEEQDNELNAQSASLSRVQGQLVSEQRNVAIAREALLAAETQIDDLLRRLQLAEEKGKAKGAIEGKLEGTQRVLEVTQSELSEMKNHLKKVEEENKTLQREHETILPQLRRELKDLRVHSEKQQEIYNAVQKELDDALMKSRNLQKELDKRSATVHELSNRCSGLDLQVNDLAHQLERARNESSTSNIRADEVSQKQRDVIREMKDTIMELKGKSDTLEEVNKALHRDLSRSQTDVDRYNEELRRSEHTVGKLSAEITMLKSSYEDKTNAHNNSVHQLTDNKEAFCALQQESLALRGRLEAAEHHILLMSRELSDEIKAKEVAREAYNAEVRIIENDRKALEEKLNATEKERAEAERKLFVLGAERNSLQAQLVTSEANVASHKETINKEVEARQKLILAKGELERTIISLETRAQQLESKIRVSEINLAAASEEVSKRDAVQRSLTEEINMKNKEHRFHLDVANHRLLNLSKERDEAIAKRTAAQMTLITASAAGPSSSHLSSLMPGSSATPARSPIRSSSNTNATRLTSYQHGLSSPSFVNASRNISYAGPFSDALSFSKPAGINHSGIVSPHRKL